MEKKEMKTLNGYEVVDAKARETLDLLSEEVVHQVSDSDYFNDVGYGLTIDGKRERATAEKMTDFIPIPTGAKTIKMYVSSEVKKTVSFYSGKSEDLIMNTTSDWNLMFEIAVPTNAKYVRCSTYVGYDVILHIDGYVLYCGELKRMIEEVSESITTETKPFSLTDAKTISKLGITQDESGNFVLKKKLGDKFYYRQKVIFPKDIHSINGEYVLFDIAGYRFSLKKATTSENNTYPICPVPVYNAGILLSAKATSRQIAFLSPDGWNKELMLGEDAMMFRFKGDTTIETNRDIRLKIDSDVVEIYHSNNNVVIESFIKSNYSTMESLYDSILAKTQAGETLEDFEVSFLNLDNLTPNDIIECDVALVSQYYRNNEQTVAEYDAFPFYFTTKQTGKSYNIEVIVDDSKNRGLQFLVNGYCMFAGGISGLANTECVITIHNTNGTGIVVEEIEFNDDSVSVYPMIRILYAEGVTEGTSQTGLDTSQKRIAGLASVMENKNLNYVNMYDIEKILEGTYKTSNQHLWHFAHDDSAIEVLNNSLIRNTYISHGIYPSLAMELSKNFSDNEKTLVKASVPLGFHYHIHAGTIKPATGIGHLSYNELSEMVDATVNKFISDFGLIPNIWDFHLITENYNVVRYLKNHGFRIIFGGNGGGCINEINRYRCKRWTFTDETLYSDITEYMDNYDNPNFTN